MIRALVLLEFTGTPAAVILENGYADARISLEDGLTGRPDWLRRRTYPIAQVVRKYKLNL